MQTHPLTHSDFLKTLPEGEAIELPREDGDRQWRLSVKLQKAQPVYVPEAEMLEQPRAEPDFESMDETAEWAVQNAETPGALPTP